MERNIIINKLRVLINALPLMNYKQAEYAVSKANAMMDTYFEETGGFLKVDIDEFKEPKCKVCGLSISECMAGHSQDVQ